jgi:hypothetical protein
MAPQPRITPRSAWRPARAVPGGRDVAPSARRWFVVHYPVMGDRPNHQWARDIERIHLNQRPPWAIIGYNYLVSNRDGEIIEGAGRDVRGIHSPPRNTDGWGVCVLLPTTAQGVATAPLSQAARNSTRALYEWLCTVAGRRLGMAGHNTHHATSCPGPDLSAWVRAGMPATGGGAAPAPQPPSPPEEVELIATETAQNGNFHVWMVGPARRTIWLTHQASGSNAWWGGQAGRGPAGFRRFADAPQGRTIRGISAKRSPGGALHLFVALDDGRTLYTWQRPDESSWRNLQAFAPAP